MSKKLFLLAALIAAVCPGVVTAQIVVDFTSDTRFDAMEIGDTVLLDKSGTSRYGEDWDSVFKLEDAQAITKLTGGSFGQGLETSEQLNRSVGGLGVGGGLTGDQGALDGDFDYYAGAGDQISFSLSNEGPLSRIVFDEFAFTGLDAGEKFTFQSDAFYRTGVFNI